MFSCTASLYKWISLTCCVATTWIFRHSNIFQKSLQRAPSAFFLLQCCLFFPRMVLYASLQYSFRNPSYIILYSLPVAVNRFIPAADIWACFTPLSTLKTYKHSVSSVCSCLLLQLPADLCTTLTIFIFLICNFCSSDLVRADSATIRYLSKTLTNWTQTMTIPR